MPIVHKVYILRHFTVTSHYRHIVLGHHIQILSYFGWLIHYIQYCEKVKECLNYLHVDVKYGLMSVKVNQLTHFQNFS